MTLLFKVRSVTKINGQESLNAVPVDSTGAVILNSKGAIMLSANEGDGLYSGYDSNDLIQVTVAEYTPPAPPAS